MDPFTLIASAVLGVAAMATRTPPTSRLPHLLGMAVDPGLPDAVPSTTVTLWSALGVRGEPLLVVGAVDDWTGDRSTVEETFVAGRGASGWRYADDSKPGAGSSLWDRLRGAWLGQRPPVEVNLEMGSTTVDFPPDTYVAGTLLFEPGRVVLEVHLKGLWIREFVEHAIRGGVPSEYRDYEEDLDLVDQVFDIVMNDVAWKWDMDGDGNIAFSLVEETITLPRFSETMQEIGKVLLRVAKEGLKEKKKANEETGETAVAVVAEHLEAHGGFEEDEDEDEDR